VHVNQPSTQIDPWRIILISYLFRQASLVSHNTILTLGHMAIALKDVQHTQQAILARFQQRLGDPPSPLDILIINQIGCMLISSLVS